MAGSHGNVHTISLRNEWDFKLFEAATNGKIIVVDFTASWCGPCRMISPVFVELSEKHPELVFLKVDVDELQDVSSDWKVRAMPTFVFIKDGQEVDRIVGANKVQLQMKIQDYATASHQEAVH